MPNRNTDSEHPSADDVPTYTPPIRGDPDLEAIPLDYADGRRLERQIAQYPNTGLERDLFMIAKQLRGYEASGRSELQKTQHARRQSFGDGTINPNREMAHPMGNMPAARRAKTAQRNFQTKKQQWAELVGRYFNQVRKIVSEDS